MKVIRWIMTIILSSQVAFAQAPMSLKEIIDDYNYAVTVEWDQKDEAFLKLQDELLKSRVNAIIGSVTEKDIAVAFAGVDVEKVNLELATHKLKTPDQIREFIKNNPVTYTQGASFVGTIIGSIVGAAVIWLGISVIQGAQETLKEREACEAAGNTWSLEGYCW